MPLRLSGFAREYIYRATSRSLFRFRYPNFNQRHLDARCSGIVVQGFACGCS